MKIEKVERVSVADSVFEQMKQMILLGEWKVGEKIAGENELVKLFGVSRVSVRDAIHRLIGMGVLKARHGDGTYVADPISGQLQSRMMQQLLLSMPKLKEVLEFRLMVEVGCAGLAAANASDDEIAQLRELNKRMQECGEDGENSTKEFAKLDLTYHNTIAVISGNSLLTRVTAVVQDIYAAAMEETIMLRGVGVGRYNHTKLTDAIASRNRPAAEELMREHIQSVIDIVP